MRNSRSRRLVLAATVVALLSFSAVPSSAGAVDWTAFLSAYDTSQLGETYGIGIRGSFPFNETWEFDVTVSYYEDFDQRVPGATKIEIGTIPMDFGVNWNQNGADGGWNAGGGLTWAFMDTGGLEIANIDIPDPGEADDEFGAYAKVGYRANNGFLFEVMYRFLDVSIESIQIPPGVITLQPIDRIDLDMDGYVINLGWRF